MTPRQRLLADIGAAMFGPQWQTRMAAALGVSGRTVRRWIAGTSPVPRGVERELVIMAQVHAAGLSALSRQLRDRL